MSVSGALARGRVMAESLMVDVCEVHRPGSEGDRDPLTGEVTMTLVYVGRAKSQTYEGYERSPEAGGHVYTVQRYRADFPVEAAWVDPEDEDTPQVPYVAQVGDVITWTGSAHSSALVGVRDQVAGPFVKSMSTAQRVFVDRIVS